MTPGRRRELTDQVGDNHAGALDIALRISDEDLEYLAEHGPTGYALWARVTAGGALSVEHGLRTLAARTVDPQRRAS